MSKNLPHNFGTLKDLFYQLDELIKTQKRLLVLKEIELELIKKEDYKETCNKYFKTIDTFINQ